MRMKRSEDGKAYLDWDIGGDKNWEDGFAMPLRFLFYGFLSGPGLNHDCGLSFFVTS
jgi:hypothetical protein